MYARTQRFQSTTTVKSLIGIALALLAFPMQAAAVLVDFSDIRSDSLWCSWTGCNRIPEVPYFGSTIHTGDISIEVLSFDGRDAGSVSALHSHDPKGQSLRAHNAKLEFDFGVALSSLGLLFDTPAAAEGFSLTINGETREAKNFFEFAGTTIGGVSVSMIYPDLLGAPSFLVLYGLIDSFAIGGSSLQLFAVNYTERCGTEVPEPSSAILLLMGGIGAAQRRRRRQ